MNVKKMAEHSRSVMRKKTRDPLFVTITCNPATGMNPCLPMTTFLCIYFKMPTNRGHRHIYDPSREA